MIYRRFGRTNLQMPVVSCGGMRYQHKWQDVPLSEVPDENQHNLDATIRRAVDLGITHIETARGYGSSERQLGLVLPKLPREKLIVQTKIGPEDDPAKFTQYFEESLERLQLDHVDLLAIHGINDRHCLDLSIRPNGCLAAARKIQQRGLAKHIGFSTHANREVIIDAITCERDGGFDYVNLHWYFIFQHNWAAILEATRRDMGVFIISPSDKGGLLYKPSERIRALTQPLHPIVFNDLFCLMHPEVHTLSIGAARPSDFDLHVAAVEQLPQAATLVPPIVARLTQALADVVPAKLRDPFAALPWWDNAPGEMNVQIMVWLHNLVAAYGLEEYGRMRYNLLGNAGHWFPGKNAVDLEKLDVSGLEKSLGLQTGELVTVLKSARDQLAGEAKKRLSQS